MKHGICWVAPLVLILTACGGGSGSTSDDGDVIKIGAIFDLTGPTSDVGTLYSEGFRDYVEWRNQNGGIDGRQIDLIFQDYGYKVDVAEQLYSQFVQEGAVAFLGWGTGDTEALRGRIADDEIPFTSASYSHVLGDPAAAPYNFLFGTTYSDQLFIILDRIRAEVPAGQTPRVALMHHPSPFGLSPYEQGGRAYAERLGIELTPVEMPRGSTDFTAQLTKMREGRNAFVVFQNTSNPAALALKNAGDMGYAPQFYCLNWCSNEVLVDLAGDNAEGVIGSIIFSPPGDGVTGLADAEAFLAAKGESIEEKGLLYGQGWVTMEILSEGIARALASGEPLTGPSIKHALESFDGFDTGGVTVPISFSASDHRGAKGMRLFQVRDGRWQSLTDFVQAKPLHEAGA